MEEKISSVLKLAELRKESFRRTLDQLNDRASSLILLTLQWKDIEDHFDSIRNTIEERSKELHLIQDSVQLKLEEVQQRENRLDVVQKPLEERFREIEAREKEFELYQKKAVEEREREIEWVESSGRELVAVSESIERKLELLQEKEERFELLNDSIDEKASQVRETKREICQALEDIKAKEMQYEQLFNELKLKEKQVEERSKIVACKDENFNRLLLELQVKEKKLKEERQKLGSKADKFKDLEVKEKQIQVRFEEMEVEKTLFMERCKEVELKDIQLNERCKEFELKEKHLVDGHSYLCVVNYAKDYRTDANLHFTGNMDGRALQIFINEHCGEYDSMRNAVLIALGLSSDPAKLVLDAMQGFYPPHLEKGDKQFEQEVVRRSCILLLEQLMKITTEIKPAVRKEAMRLAFDWITKMKVDAEHSLEVLGFLQLLASYGLAPSFDADELLTQLEIVARHSRAPELFRVLGFGDKISGFIENLIRKKQYVEAIRFIYAFELVSEFPPVPLLNVYLTDSKNAAKRLRRQTKSLEGQIEAANKRIADLRCALGCIEDYKIEYGPSFGNLKRLVEYFERENSKRKANLAVPGHNVRRTLHNNKKKHLARTVPVKDAPDTAFAICPLPTCSPAATLTCAPVTSSQSHQLSGNKHPWTAVSAQDNLNACRGANKATCTVPILVKLEQSSLGDLPSESKEACATLDPQPKPNCFSVNTSEEDLRLLLNMLENHQLEDGEIAAALRSACDPGKLVLDVMNIYFPFKLKRNKDFKSHIPEKNFIFLLEQLRKVFPQINAEIKEQAKKFAVSWKTIVAKNRKGPLEVICFMQFLAAYRLASIFNAEELLGLLDTNHWRKEAPNLCGVLGLAEKIPSFIKGRIKREQHLEAVKYIYALDVVDEFPPLAILKNHLTNSSNKRGKTFGAEIGNIVREIKSLKNVIKCIADYKISGLSPENLKERIVQLEERTVKLKIQASEVKVEQFCASAPNTQRQLRSGDKRPRIHISSEDLPKASIGSISAVCSMPPPMQHPPGSYTNQGIACMNPAPGHYSSLDSLGASVIPSYHWSAFANLDHDRP